MPVEYSVALGTGSRTSTISGRREVVLLAWLTMGSSFVLRMWNWERHGDVNEEETMGQGKQRLPLRPCAHQRSAKFFCSVKAYCLLDMGRSLRNVDVVG